MNSIPLCASCEIASFPPLHYGRACGILTYPMSNQLVSGSREPANSRTPCPRCLALDTKLGTRAERFVYLRCGACFEVWALPERRAFQRASVEPFTSPPGPPSSISKRVAWTD